MPDSPERQDGTALIYRVSALERDVAGLKEQFNRYVPVKENELQLKSMSSALDRTEQEVREIKNQLNELNAKLVTQENVAQQRDAQQRESQAALQIRVLWGTVSTVITILVAVLVGFLTHFFH